MASDIHYQSWILRLSPKWLEPYFRLIRLDRPVPIVLFILPAFWGLLGSGVRPPFSFFFVFAVGAFLLRSAGCVINDIIDHKIDAKVERTKKRPLASKELSLYQGALCLTALLCLAFPLLFFLTSTAIYLGLLLLGLIALYPLMKRFTYWPQLFLGLTVNWSILMAWAVIEESSLIKGTLLFIVGVTWTLFYDTLYAHQDKKDDSVIGVKSSALKLNIKTKSFLKGLLFLKSICLVFFLLYNFHFSGRAVDLTFLASTGFFMMAIGSLAYTLQFTDLEDPASCLKGFKQSQYFGWFVLGGVYFLS